MTNIVTPQKETSKYTHIGIEKPVKRKIAILASVKGGQIKSIVGEWAEKAWQEALANGLVTEAMLNAAAKKREAA